MTREYGSGSVEQYAPGKWRVRVRIEGKMKTVGSALSERQAQEYANAVVAVQIRTNAFTVRNLVELVRGMRMRRDDLKPSTIRGERSVWDAINADLGDVLVVDIDRKRLKSWLERTPKANTKRNRLNCLRWAFDHAIELEFITANPCAGIKPGKSGKLTKSELLTNMLGPAHQAAMIQELSAPKRLVLSKVPEQDQLKREFLLSAILFALGTGCRLSEQWGVKREDVTDDGVLICRSEANEAPKSGDWRNVPRLPATDAALRILESLRTRVPALADSEWLFPGWRGEQRRWNKQPKGWHDLLKACRIQARPWHWLRHTCATALVAGWWSETGEAWSLEETRALLGHSSVTTTEIYTQLLDEKAFKAALKTFQNRSTAERAPVLNFSEICAGANWGNRTPDLRFTKPEKSTATARGSSGKSLQDRNDGPDLAWARRVAAEAHGGDAEFGPWALRLIGGES